MIRETLINPLYVCVILAILNHTFFGGARLNVLLYAADLHASAALVGLVSSLFTIPSIFMSVAMGRWTDRAGTRRPMQIGSGLMFAGGLIGFFWRDIVGLGIASAVIGSAFNLFFIAHQRFTGEFGAPEDRAKNFSMAALGFSTASFLGPIAAGFFIESFGHAASMLLLSFTALASVAILALGMRSAAPRRAADKRPKGSMLALVRQPGMLRIYGVSVLAQSTWVIVIFLVPLYGTQIGLSPSSIGMLMGSFALATIVVRVVLPGLSRKLTPWQLVLLSLSVSALTFLAMPAFKSMGTLAVLVFWLGLSLGIAGPMSQTLLYDESPPERVGEALGLRVLMMNISHSIVPLFSGAVSAAYGVAPVFWALAATLLGGCYATRAQWRTDRKRA